MHFDAFLDTKGLKCPQPILRAKRALSNLHDGQILKVEATDPAALTDFQAFCQHTHNILRQYAPLDNNAWPDGGVVIWIERSRQPQSKT